MILTHPEQYMGTKEASGLWGYHQNTISRWCQAGKIPRCGTGCPLQPLAHPPGHPMSHAPEAQKIHPLPVEKHGMDFFVLF